MPTPTLVTPATPRPPSPRSAAGTAALALLAGVAASASGALVADVPPDYASNLELIRSASPRNTNHDGSPWRSTPQRALELSNHLGPRSDYLRREGTTSNISGGNLPGANPEDWYPVEKGGQFRISCEFSHFSYDDPIDAWGEPGGAHLQMVWGNTDVNAYSTYDTLVNSGSSTCNGQEINRTAYWMPALFDGEGNVRIPMRALIYYKGYGLANGRSEVYPPNAVIVARENLHLVSNLDGGLLTGEGNDEKAIVCSDQFSGPNTPRSNTMLDCPGGGPLGETIRTIELHVKFPNCWNGEDPSNPDNWRRPLAGVWFYSDCQGWATTPNIEYLVLYQVDAGESTRDWYLASDVNRETLEIDRPRGSTMDGSWWGGWREDVNRTWLDECVNFAIPGVPSGCGNGFLSDAGPDNTRPPKPGPALKFRPQYDRPQDGAPKVAAATLYEQLCPGGKRIASPEGAAWCTRDDVPVTEPEPPVAPELPVAPEPPTEPEPPVTGLAPGSGLRAEYHDDRFFAEPVGSGLAGPLDIDLTRTVPTGSGITASDDVSIRWSGYLVPERTETLSLWTRSDDGVRVYVDGVKVIDNWTLHAATIDTATVTLEAGRAHAISVQYFQAGGGSALQFGWQRDGEARELIAKRYLYPSYPL